MNRLDKAVVAAARALSNATADVCGVDREDQWALYGEQYITDAILVLEAASTAAQVVPPAVTAQAGRPGACENRKQPGGCPLHNLQCGYPACDMPIAAQVAEQPAAETWRPIETAPRSFSPPLSPINHHAPDILGRWGESFYCVCSWGGPSMPYWIDGNNRKIAFQPTHWMPLPPVEPTADPVREQMLQALASAAEELLEAIDATPAIDTSGQFWRISAKYTKLRAAIAAAGKGRPAP